MSDLSQELERSSSGNGLSCPVSIVEDDGLTPTERLGVALDRCGAWTHLSRITNTAGAKREDVSVLIVPELGGFESGSPAATDPTLVEGLIDLLSDRGFANVAIGAGADTSALWAANRDAYSLIDLLGYAYSTPNGNDYDVIDLCGDLEPAPFQPGALLAGSQLNQSWMAADVRIVFGANRTDDYAGYHLALATTMRALPYVDDNYHYRLAAPEGVVLDELLAATPVHLAIIDAVISSHGWSGVRAPQPLATNCIMASPDVRVVDHVGALKMGLDPGVSPLVSSTSPTLGSLSVDGSLAPYPGWKNPHPVLLESTQLRDRSWLWSRLVPPWLQVLDAESFPLESPIDAGINQQTAPFFARCDEDPLAFASLVTANQALARLDDVLNNYRLLFNKDAIRRERVALGFDASQIPRDDFVALVPELDGLAALLDDAPMRAPGLRWRSLGGATLFDYRRAIPIPLDEFMSHVDLSKVIGYMNDYIGGHIVELEHDDVGRTVRQAERNLYLPQPNYVALWGAKPIDVSKIEFVTYREQASTIYWKTIDSLNESAVYDDGAVTFSASALGTTVTFFGRQQFVLPEALEAVDRGLDPDIRDRLVTDAYANFFSRTVANLEALCEGREIRIGRTWCDDPDPAAHEPLPALALEELADDAIDWFDSLARSAEVMQRTAGHDGRIDADGFTHVGRLGDRAER